MKFAKISRLMFVILIYCVEVLHPAPESNTKNSIASRVYGDDYTPAVPSQIQGMPGTLDTTFAQGGYANLTDQMAGGIAVTVQTLADGDFLVVLQTTGVNSLIAKYNAQGVLQPSYGVDGVVDLGSSAIYPCAGMIDAQNRMVVGGGTVPGTSGWISRVSEYGDEITSFQVGSSWQYINFLGQQTTGKIIAAGSNQNNAQLARFNLDGSLDRTFGISGFISFNGTNGLPIVTSGFDFVIDADDLIYVTFVDTNFNVFVAKFLSTGALDTSWAVGGIQPISYLSPAEQGWESALDVHGNLIITAAYNGVIKVTAIATSTGGPASPAFTNTVISSADEILTIGGIITTQNPANQDLSSVIIIGTNRTAQLQRINKLYGTGGYDTSFNNGLGYIQWSAINNGSNSYLDSISLAPTGEIYTCGQEADDAAVISPFVYKMYNNYAVENSLYPRQVTEQGVIDTTFGVPSESSNQKQIYPGIVMPYVGSYRGSLAQHPSAILQVATDNGESLPAQGNFIVGMYGSINNSNPEYPVNMMLNFLTQDGLLDTNVGSNGSGQLILDNEIDRNEFLYAMTQDLNGALYVAGASYNYGSILRKYTRTSTNEWTQGTSAWSIIDRNPFTCQGVAVALQGQSLVILCQNVNSSQGRIVAYDQETGHLANGLDEAPSFGYEGSGIINSTSYSGLSLGPVYDCALNDQGSIFTAYVSVASGLVDIAGLNATGSGLLSNFGSDGIAYNIFSLTDVDSVDRSSVRIVFDNAGNLVVAAVVNSTVMVTKYNQVTGLIDRTFGIEGRVILPLSTPSITSLRGVSDGSILISGSFNGTTMYLLRLTSMGVLDTTFNSQGTVPGIAEIAVQHNPIQANLTDFTLDNSTGNVVIAGSENLYYTDGSPCVGRVFGAPDTIAVKNYPDYIQDLGTRDVSFNGSGAYNLSDLIADGTAQVLYVYPFGSQYQGLVLVGMSDDNYSYVARFNPISLSLDTTFNAQETPGYYRTDIGKVAITCLMVDADNKIVFAGYDDTVSWAQRLTADGRFDVAFNLSQVNQINAIGQQKSGRYICAGNIINVSYGVFAFQDELVENSSQLQLDTTFNPLGNIPGAFGITNSLIYSLVINDDDTILTGWASGGDSRVYVNKIMANGSGFVTAFGIQGGANTGIVVTDMFDSVCMACDEQGNILVGSSIDVDDIAVVRLLADTGAIDTSWNSGSVGIYNGFGHSVKLKDIITSTTGQTVFIGYNVIRRVNGINGPLFAVSLNQNGALDTTWNPYPSGQDVPGILTYHVAGSTLMGQGGFAPSGNLFVVGGTGDQPLIMEIVAAGVPVQQDPLAVDAGIVDRTINTQNTDYDALNLNTLSGLLLGLPSQLHSINGGNGAMLMTSQLDTTSYLTKFNAALQLDRNFNAPAELPSVPGLVAFDSTASIHSLFVQDAQGDSGTIYVTGDTQDATMWAAIISPDGYDTNRLTVPNSLTTGRAICKGNNNVLIAGQSSIEGTPGVIFACTSDMSGIDTSFGNGTPGYFSTGINSPISAVAVDNQYRIYIAYKSISRNRLVVQRLSADGSTIDFIGQNSPHSCNPQQIKMALDQQNDQFVVANYHYSALYVSRYSMIDGSLQGSCQVYINSESLELSDLIIDTDQNIYLVGYNVGDERQTIVARIRSIDQTNIELDPTYAADGATPGIANIVVTPMDSSGSLIGAGILHPDRRIYIAGATSDNIPYMARFFGNMYAQEVCQAVRALVPGMFDPTYGNSFGYVTTFAGSDPYNPTEGQQVKDIIHLPGTTLMTVVDNGINSWMVKVLQDGTNDPIFGNPSGQGALIDALDGNEIVRSMIASSTEEFFVVGQNSNYGGYLKKIKPDGVMNQNFGGYTGVASTQSYPLGTVYGLMSNPSSLVELSDGSIVIAGDNQGVGTLQKIGTTGLVAQDFVPLSQELCGAHIASIVADASNNLYCAIGFAFDEGYAVRIVKLNQNGVVIWQNDTALFGAYDQYEIQLALDGLGNILVATTSGQQHGNLHVTRLLDSGLVDPDFNSGTPLNVQVSNSADFALAHVADLICVQDGKTMIAGSYQDLVIAENNAQFVVCVDRFGALDTSFNYDQSQGLVQGIALFATGIASQQARTVFAMDIQADGKIILAASQSAITDEYEPLTIRLIGYNYDQAIAKYPGTTLELSSVLDTSFDQTGIATTGLTIEQLLVEGGSVVVDLMGRTIIAGLTETGAFVVARFLADGTFDRTFGVDGVGFGPEVLGMVANCSLTIDLSDNVYVSGVSADVGQQGQFVMVKFDTTGTLDTSFGTDGLLTLSPSANLIRGGYSTYDAGNDYLIIGGYSSDGNFIIYRYTADGHEQIDAIETNQSSGLIDGGYVAVDRDHSLYIAGQTATSLVVMKFIQFQDVDLQLDYDFGVDGIATVQIPNLVQGGPITLDFYNNIVIAGYTSALECCLARLTGAGILDLSFNNTGIAYSVPVTNLQNIGSVSVGSLNDVIVGGYARSYSGIGNFVVSNFTTNGNRNVGFTPTGTAVIDLSSAIRTISNAGLSGGFIAINPQGQIFVGGIDIPTITTPGGSKFVVAKCYSGYETFITDLGLLSPENLKNHFYGNDIDFVNRALSVDLFAAVIADRTVRQVVINSIQAIFNNYYLRYTGVAGFNLVGHVYLVELELQALQNLLVENYPDWADEIAQCCHAVIERIVTLKLS